jgi:hypothetical protein
MAAKRVSLAKFDHFGEVVAGATSLIKRSIPASHTGFLGPARKQTAESPRVD